LPCWQKDTLNGDGYILNCEIKENKIKMKHQQALYFVCAKSRVV